MAGICTAYANTSIFHILCTKEAKRGQMYVQVASLTITSKRLTGPTCLYNTMMLTIMVIVMMIMMMMRWKTLAV